MREVNLKDTIAGINDMQTEKVIGQYAIGGAVAASFYVEAAETEDVDVFAALASTEDSGLLTLQPIYEYARARNWPSVGLYIVIAGWKVQFLPPSGPLVEEAIGKATEQDLDGMPVRVFTPEYLVAIALQVGRPKDKIRAQQFLETSRIPGAKFQLDAPLLSSILERHQLLEKWAKFQRQMGG